MDLVTLTVAIWLVISEKMVGDGVAKLRNLSFSLSEEYKGVAVNGKIELSDITLNGLQTMKLVLGDIQVETEDKNFNNDVCIKNFVIGNISVSSKYHADISFMDIIPFYGDGAFSVSLNNVNAEVCFKAISNGKEVVKGLEKLKITMKYRHKPIEIKGFFKNPKADELLLQFAELFNVFLAMWHNYDPEGASCFFSPLVEFAVNAQLGYEKNVLTFDAEKCLWKGTPFGDLGKIQFQTFMALYQDLVKYIRENKME